MQKGKGVVSFTGEKIYETQVMAAVDQALANRRGKYHFIAAVAELVHGTTPRLVFLIEFDNPITNDEGTVPGRPTRCRGGEQNVEYQTKRKSLRYGPPVIRTVRSGEYDRYRRRKVEEGRADGQFKILRLTSDTSFASSSTGNGNSSDNGAELPPAWVRCARSLPLRSRAADQRSRGRRLRIHVAA